MIRLDKLGPEHVNIATSYNNLSLIYQDLGDLEKAKEYQQRALAIQLDKLGPEHVDVHAGFCMLSLINNLDDHEQTNWSEEERLLSDT